MVSFTVDLEDPTEAYLPSGRYIQMTYRVLEFCRELGIKGTFFIVGKVISASPDLIRAISNGGHEIAYHSHNHISLTNETNDRFRLQSLRDKTMLEDLGGKAVVGFRAPRFSLTPKSLWALDTLADLGFDYSSSIMPTSISRFGYPAANSVPFRWPNGMIEFPLPVAKFGPLRIPYLGGIYLYALPSFIVKHWIGRAKMEEVLWTYTHPYDFDREENFYFMPDTPKWISITLWLSRRVAEKKLRNILQSGITSTLQEQCILFKARYNDL